MDINNSMEEIRTIYEQRIERIRPTWDWYTSRQGLFDILWGLKWLSVIFAISWAVVARNPVSMPYVIIIIVISVLGWKPNRKESE